MGVVKIEVKVNKIHCLRCGHEWIPRKSDVRLCPSCKSAYFDKPRNTPKNPDKEESNGSKLRRSQSSS